MEKLVEKDAVGTLVYLILKTAEEGVTPKSKGMKGVMADQANVWAKRLSADDSEETKDLIKDTVREYAEYNPVSSDFLENLAKLLGDNHQYLLFYRIIEKEINFLGVGEDLKEHLEEKLEDMAEGHLETWKERYSRKSVEDVVFDIRMNHDDSGEIEAVEEALDRELSDAEKTYVSEEFLKKVEEIYYL